MPVLRMSRFCIIITIVTLYMASGEKPEDDKNVIWRDNDRMLRNIDTYYNMLPRVTNDVKNRRKRFIAVISLALCYYGESDQETRLTRVEEAVARTRAQLGKTADALGGQITTFLSLLRTAIDQPINDIKVSCRPDTEARQCLINLKMYRDQNVAECQQYDENVNLYEKAKHLFTDPQFEELVQYIDRHQRTDSDLAALSQFRIIALIKYRDLVNKGRDVYRLRANMTSACSSRNLPLY